MWTIRTLIFFCLVFSISARARDHHKHEATPAVKKAAKVPGGSLYNLTGAWLGTGGEAFPLSRLKGNPVVLTMAYTQCKASCPVIIAKLKEIETALKAAGAPEVTIVLASFDPKRDTPSSLASYAKDRNLDPKRWVLLSPKGDRDVRELAAVLGIAYSKDKDGEFSHSNAIVLLDKDGVIKTQLNGLAVSHDELVELAAKDSHGG